MKLESNGILISLRPLNERDSIARIFTYEYGIIVGVMRGAIVAKKNKPLIGQYGNATWNARLDSQLGVFHWESEKNLSTPLITDIKKLSAMNAAFDILSTLLPEHEPYKNLYNETIKLLNDIQSTPNKAYLNWEIQLLRELGYALDLSKCSGCGATTNLNHLSPRTGRAVCDKCATPYINKLYKLPLNLPTTLRFLENVCQQQGTQIPTMRAILKLA